jgi:macrolide transport system ATP-binding/permease protein
MGIEIAQVQRGFKQRHTELHVLNDVNLTLEPGEFVAIMGPSGGGKSTLLNILGLLDFPDSGTYLLDDELVRAGDVKQASKLRSSKFAFVFQGFHLLEKRQAIDSVELGLLYRGVGPRARRRRALVALERVGLTEKAFEMASNLSGGQQQRVAIARAIASDAPIVLADEPTGNLDATTGAAIIGTLKELQAQGVIVVVVTHSDEVASAADRVLTLEAGVLVESVRTAPLAVRTDYAQLDPRDAGERASAVRVRDLITDALASLKSRSTTTFALAAAVALAVGLAVTTLGISDSAQAQVTATFDSHLNREVTVSLNPDSSAGPTDVTVQAMAQTLTELSGVDAAGIIFDFPPQSLDAGEGRPPVTVQVHSSVGDVVEAAGLTVRWTDGQPVPISPSDVLVGSSLAKQIMMGPLEGRPTIQIGGVAYVVVGVITKSPRLPLLLGEVLASGEALSVGSPTRASAILLTQPGAAQQVAGQAPLVIDPYEPERLTVQAPVDAGGLRQEVESGVQFTLLALTALAALAAAASLANAMLLAVTERRSEIGLRIAVGARPRHIASLLATESLFIGVLGGVLGLVLGLLIVMTVTIVQRWTPIFDIRLAPLAVLGGAVIGVAGGSLASYKAARIRPAQALRL